MRTRRVRKTEAQKALEATAYHEAGHAVAMVYLKSSFRSVTIEATEFVLGHVALDDEEP